MAEIKPLGSRVLAEPIEADAKTAAGILLPSDAKEEIKLAKVVAVGARVKEIKPGDTILHQEYGTHKVDGKDYVIVKEKEILAVVK